MAIFFENPKKNDEDEGQGNWIVTYADMVTLLLCFFVLLFAASKTEDHKLKALSDAFKLQPWISSPFVQHGEESMLKLGRIADNNNTMVYNSTMRTISFSDIAMFNPGSQKLKKQAIEKLKLVAQILYRIPNTIIIEGHTDDLPIQTELFPSNWELSAARAASVARVLEGFGIKAQRFEVRAYGSTKPKTANDSDDGRRLNRRINIVINP